MSMSQSNTKAKGDRPVLNLCIEVTSTSEKGTRKFLSRAGGLWYTQAENGYSGTLVDHLGGRVRRIVVLPEENRQSDRSAHWAVFMQVGDGDDRKLMRMGSGWERPTGKLGFTGELTDAFSGTSIRFACLPPDYPRGSAGNDAEDSDEVDPLLDDDIGF